MPILVFRMDRSRCSRCADLVVHVGPIWAFTMDRNPQYGQGRWRKLKGIAMVRLRSGTLRRAELHWYEAHGIGRKKIKRRRYVD